MRGIVLKLAIGLLLLICSCASVPKEAVELSVTLGRDLNEVHRANRELANRFFDRIEDDIIRFIDQVYIPHSIATNARDFGVIDSITAAVNRGDTTALYFMATFVKIMNEDFQAIRDSLLGPVRQYRSSVVRSIDDSFQKLLAANSIVTGHLASIRKVHDAQDEWLGRVGLTGFREKLINQTAAFSDDIAELTAKGSRAEATLADIIEAKEKLMEKVNGAKDDFR